MTKDRKISLQKKKAKQGTDCYSFEIICKKNVDALLPVELFNKKGRCYGNIKRERGKIILHLVLPHYVRPNNNVPFGVKDDCEKVYKGICRDLRLVLGDEFESKLLSVECNITREVEMYTSCSDVLNLLNHALLSYSNDNLEYAGPDKCCALKKDIHTVIATRPHYYTVKAYNKTEEYWKKHKTQYIGCIGDYENDVLRMEIILLRRTIKRLFGEKTSVYDILTSNSLIEIIREYKRIYSVEIIKGCVRPYLTECKREIVKSLWETNSIAETIAKKQELVLDKEVLHKAIKEWQNAKGVSPHAARDVKRYTRSFGLPQEVILTLKEFRMSCG